MNTIYDSFDVLEGSAKRVRSGLGSIALFTGLALLGLLLAEVEGPLPIRMPRSWYADRGLWMLVGIAGLIAGWILLRDDDSHESDGRGSASGLRFRTVRLYSRSGCHLCDSAQETLEKYGDVIPYVELIDIDSETSLAERFGHCVPVVEIDGKVRFRGRINELLLRRLIAATPPLKPCGKHCGCRVPVSDRSEPTM